MTKKVLFVFPDYSHTCLRSIQLFTDRGYSVDIAVAYHYRLIPRFIRHFSHSALQKLYKRRMLVEQLLLEIPKERLNVISLSPLQLIKSFYKGHFVRKRPFYNILKDMIQEDLCPRIDYHPYTVLYLFDTVAYLFQEEAKKIGIKTILECRGPHFYFSQNLRLKLEANDTKQSVQEYVPENSNDEWWYRKLTSEPEMADYLICYSEFHAQQYVENSSKKRDQVFLLPLPSTIKKSKFIKKHNGKDLSFYFAGNINSLKGVGQLLKAWKIISSNLGEEPSVSLHFYGPCTDEHYLKAFSTDETIFFHGKVLHHELIQKVKNHDVCIFPSLLDSYGFALQEALQLNIPVISNYTSGASFLYEHEVHGYKCNDSYNSLELANCINQFINNPSLIEEFSAALNQLPDYNANYMNTLGKKNIEKLFEEIA